MSWKEIAGQIAPTIATALGTPLIGLAVSTLCEALGLPAGSTESDIEKQLAVNPESYLKLKQAELTFQQRIAELEIDLERIASEDRNSARQREVSTGDHTPRVLAAIIVGGYIIIQYFILTHLIADEMRELVMRSLGLMDGALTMVLSYYFGSSASSARKNEIIAATTKQ